MRKNGCFCAIYRFANRSVLLFGIVALVLLGAWLPTRILFITTEGNDTIPSLRIIEQAEKCGISFGAARKNIRSEKMKNHLLEELPDLQWAGINTYGCTAVISVEEREASAVQKKTGLLGHVVAEVDGVIESCTSIRGNLVCQVGQAVQKGEILISGITEVGQCTHLSQAAGEIYAQTKRELQVLAPGNFVKKGKMITSDKTYGVIIGKKRIFLSKGSGISGTTCDKMYERYYITLPGGFQLPLGIFVYYTATYSPLAYCSGLDEKQIIAAQAARQYVLSNMISGEILSENIRTQTEGEVYVINACYICREMIGRVQYEEITHQYGKNN